MERGEKRFQVCKNLSHEADYHFTSLEKHINVIDLNLQGDSPIMALLYLQNSGESLSI